MFVTCPDLGCAGSGEVRPVWRKTPEPRAGKNQQPYLYMEGPDACTAEYTASLLGRAGKSQQPYPFEPSGYALRTRVPSWKLVRSAGNLITLVRGRARE